MSYDFINAKLVDIKSNNDNINNVPIMYLTFSISGLDQDITKKIDQLIKEHRTEWNYRIDIDYSNNSIKINAMRKK